jgi:Lignostilbene-alpha,beta-dioxygenase and related enzymes
MQLGFHSVTAEHTDVAVAVEGQIPPWLEGTLIRNGPGRFDTAGGTVNHWFDGLAMLRAYRFADGTLRYTNRLLRTAAYAAADRGQLTGQFATDGGTLSRLLRPLQLLRGAAGTDNTNVHVAAVDGALVALTETDTRIAVDPTTLRVRGHFRFDDTIREDLPTAHLAVDHTTGESFGLATTFAPRPRYHLLRVGPEGRRRSTLATVPARGPAYIHDLAVSPSAVLFIETPLQLSARAALSPLSDGPIDMLRWRPDAGARIHRIDRSDGSHTTHAVAPTFCFHIMAAADTADGHVVDAVTFRDGQIVEDLRLDRLRAAGFPDGPQGRLTRYRITDDGVSASTLTDVGVAFPRVAPGDDAVGYAQVTDPVDATGVCRIDRGDGATTSWHRSGRYCEEPVPVGGPDGQTVVLVPTLDVAAGCTRLRICDGDTLEPHAVATLPVAEPFGFHGRWFPTGTFSSAEGSHA